MHLSREFAINVPKRDERIVDYAQELAVFKRQVKVSLANTVDCHSHEFASEVGDPEEVVSRRNQGRASSLSSLAATRAHWTCRHRFRLIPPLIPQVAPLSGHLSSLSYSLPVMSKNYWLPAGYHCSYDTRYTTLHYVTLRYTTLH